jgi:hypothetical protein
VTDNPDRPEQNFPMEPPSGYPVGSLPDKLVRSAREAGRAAGQSVKALHERGTGKLPDRFPAMTLALDNSVAVIEEIRTALEATRLDLALLATQLRHVAAASSPAEVPADPLPDPRGPCVHCGCTGYRWDRVSVQTCECSHTSASHHTSTWSSKVPARVTGDPCNICPCPGYQADAAPGSDGRCTCGHYSYQHTERHA